MKILEQKSLLQFAILTVIFFLSIIGYLAYQSILSKFDNNGVVMNRFDRQLVNLAKSNRENIGKVTQNMYEQFALRSSTTISATPVNTIPVRTDFQQDEILSDINDQYELITQLSTQIDELKNQLNYYQGQSQVVVETNMETRKNHTAEETEQRIDQFEQG